MTSASDADTSSARAPSRVDRLASWSASNQYVGVLLVLVCLVIVFSIQEPRFLTVANIRVLLTGVAILWMISLGLTVVMLTGGFLCLAVERASPCRRRSGGGGGVVIGVAEAQGRGMVTPTGPNGAVTPGT